jgi:carboxylesterase
MTMKHQEIIHIVPGADTAILLVHGIIGTPHHFYQLMPMIPENWSVYNLLLAGHGKGVKEFSKASVKQWRSQVEARVEEILAVHRRVIIVAHSMGTLFAIQAAVRYPERVAQLFLLSSPLRPWVALRGAVSAVKLGLGLAGSKDKIAMAMKEDAGVELSAWPWEYIPWIPIFLELLWECRKTRALIPEVKVPCEAYHADRDELVSRRSVQDLRKNSDIQITILPDTGHFIYEGQALNLLQQRFAEMVNRNL